MRKLLVLCILMLTAGAHAETFLSGHPRTTDNDDSCDIAQLPAATLLLPYFEVDLTSGTGEQTIFTVTNVSPEEQIAHVTLWTDWSYPILAFNIYLTGYDVQAISLYDLIARGEVAPSRGTGFEDEGSPIGDFSRENRLVRSQTCRDLPAMITPSARARLQQALTTGTLPSQEECTIGSSTRTSMHARNANAIGFATIDVVRSCNTATPADQEYYAELLFDNVLTGDYQQVNSTQGYAQSNPLVHIRAVPEGHTPTTRRDTNLPRTFYSAFQSAPNNVRDGRQPLPSTFAARWIDGGPGSFETSFKIWREQANGTDRSCAAYGIRNNSTVVDLIRFDEEENATASMPPLNQSPPVVVDPRLPSAIRIDVADNDFFPDPYEAALGGWMYLNLDAEGQHEFPRQAWVVTSMRAQGRHSGDHDATALGNGCSPRVAASEVNEDGYAIIAPAPNPNP